MSRDYINTIEPPYNSLETIINNNLPKIAPHLSDLVGWKPSQLEDGIGDEPTREMAATTYQPRPQNPEVQLERKFDIGSDFKRYQLPRVIAHLLESDILHRDHPNRIAILGHDDKFYLEWAVLRYLEFSGFEISGVFCYNPHAKVDKLYQSLSKMDEFTQPGTHPKLSERVHFYNRSSVSQLYQDILPGLTCIFGLNCNITGVSPPTNDRFTESIAVTDKLAYIMRLLFPKESNLNDISLLLSNYQAHVPNVNFVCEPRGYYGKLKPITPIFSEGVVSPPIRLLNIIDQYFINTLRIPETRPVGITDQSLLDFWNCPYLDFTRLSHRTDLPGWVHDWLTVANGT